METLPNTRFFKCSEFWDVGFAGILESLNFRKAKPEFQIHSEITEAPNYGTVSGVPNTPNLKHVTKN